MTYRGMMIAIDEEAWLVFRNATASQLAQLLRKLAKNVKMSKYLKHPRGPKKPKKKPKNDSKRPHVSTARLISNKNK